MADSPTPISVPVARSPRVALWIFGLLVVAGPLVFGLVDRLWQCVAVLFFAAGLFAAPASLPRPGRWARTGLLVLIGLVMMKEFLPVVLWPGPDWRGIFSVDYQIPLTFTRNPQPALAADLLIVSALACLWVCWVRSVAASSRSFTVPLLLLISAATLSAVSLAMKIWDPEWIYGVRLVRGWQGFGPFPNRNHTASLLAMGTVIGMGCVFHCFRRKFWTALAVSATLTMVTGAGLLASGSRGAFVACAAGLLLFLATSARRSRNRAGFAVAAGLMFLGVAVLLSVRSEVLIRIFSPEVTDRLSASGRADIWHDTLRMWWDAPFFGQGLGTFRVAFPFYRTIDLANNGILHPESTWLLWLAELGLLPWLLAAAVAGGFLWAAWSEHGDPDRASSLRLAGWCAFAVLVIHSLIDVPFGRWGSGGYGLACLAMACPRMPRQHGGWLRPAWIGVAALGFFWMQTFFTGQPAWNVAAKERVLLRWNDPRWTTLSGMNDILRYFPFDAPIRQVAAWYALATPGGTRAAWRHFAILNRLLPDNWILPQQQALIAAPFDPSMALSYWSLAVERAGDKAGEIFQSALSETRAMPGAGEFWRAFLKTHPALLPTYAQLRPTEEQSSLLGQWLRQKAASENLAPYELEAFYTLLQARPDPELIDLWMRLHPEWAKRDAMEWSAILQRSGDAAKAWELLAGIHPEPSFPPMPGLPATDKLERQSRVNPADWLNAQQLAFAYEQAGRATDRDRAILAAGLHPDAPDWFRFRAAHVLAREGRLDEAVKLLLKKKTVAPAPAN